MDYKQLCAELKGRAKKLRMSNVYIKNKTGLSIGHICNLLGGKLENCFLDSLLKVANCLETEITFSLSDK